MRISNHNKLAEIDKEDKMASPKICLIISLESKKDGIDIFLYNFLPCIQLVNRLETVIRNVKSNGDLKSIILQFFLKIFPGKITSKSMLIWLSINLSKPDKFIISLFKTT